MLKRIMEIFESIPATIISGVFLLSSFILSKFEIDLLIDLAVVTVIISGLPLVFSAIKKLIKNKGISKISSALLITVAMTAAIIIGDLFAAGEVAFIMAIGEILEDITTSRAKKGLKKLINLAPASGRRIKEGKEEIISAKDILKDDVLRILPGETITVDGVIIQGETSVDQSVITGESLPIDKSVNDSVFCGTVNLFGTIDVKATKVGQDSSLQKLIRLVKEAENKKAPMARTADKCASWLVPAALLIAVITGIITTDITRAVTVLVVFCPCALVLATPTAIMAAIGQATKHGVVIKSGEALEIMGKVDTFAFDKTGTITEGKLKVINVVSFKEEINNDELLTLTASAERKSEHPLAKAIVNFAIEEKLSLLESENFKMFAGKGITANVNGKNIICANENFMKTSGINFSDSVRLIADEFRAEGKALIFVASEKEVIGIIALSDTLRKEIPQTVKELQKLYTNTVLLTGDNRLTAEYFAEKSSIREVKSELLPEEKVKIIEEIKLQNNTVCMIGDGINDAPALKTADVGIAIGGMGSDIAVESADIALMNDDISKIPYLKRLANATVKTIKFSISLSMFINVLAVVLSVLGLLNPTTGALVHNAGSCFVILIAALLYDRKFK